MRTGLVHLLLVLIALTASGCGDSSGTTTASGTSDATIETTSSEGEKPATSAPPVTTTKSTTTTVPPTTTTAAVSTTTTVATGIAVTANAAHDGLWVGATSEGEDFTLRIDNGDVVAVLVGFGGECATDSPMAAESFGRPLGTVVGDTLTALLSGLYRAEIDGRFVSSVALEGNVLLDLGPGCGGSHALTWVAILSDEGAGTAVAADWYGATPPTGVLPTYQIPAGLRDPAAGSTRFDPNGGVFEDDGDWYLIGSWMQSFIAVPAGWSTSETGTSTLLMFSEEGDLVVDFGEIVEGEPEIFVRLTSIGYEGDTETIEATVSTVASGMEASGPDVTVIASEVAPDNRGYVLAELPWKGDTRRVLIVLAKNPELGWFHAIQAIFDSTAQWDAYYPIVRAIGSWYGLYDNHLGLELPAEPRG